MGLFNILKKKKVQSGTKTEHEEFLLIMQSNADALVSDFGKKYPSLDFSITSLSAVDLLLQDAAYRFNSWEEIQQNTLTVNISSYIFEVARQNFGGCYSWYERLSQPILVTGQPEFEMSLITYEKVRERLRNDNKDSISFFFADFAEGVAQKNSALII